MLVYMAGVVVVPHEVICARFKRLMNRCKPRHHLIQCSTIDILLHHCYGLTTGDSMTMVDEEDLWCLTNQPHL